MSVKEGVVVNKGPLVTSGKPLARSLHEQIADNIARDIVNGVLEPRQKLSEVALAEQFGTSRGPIRDALSLLESNHLVTIKPRSATFVNLITLDSLEQLFILRGHLFGIIARYAARNCRGQEVEELKALLNSVQEAYAQSGADMQYYFRGAQVIWDKIFRVCRARVIAQAANHYTGGSIWQIALQDRLTASDVKLSAEHSFAFWRQLLVAIEKRDEQKAEHIAGEMINHTWQMYRDVFKQHFPN